MDDHITIPVTSIWNQRVEILIATIFSREIVNVHRSHRISLENSGVTRKYNVTARQNIKSGRSKLNRLLSEEHSRKPERTEQL